MKTYLPPLTGAPADLGDSLLMEAHTSGPAFVRSRAAGRWHIVRSAVSRMVPWDDEICTTWHYWCGPFASSGKGALLVDTVPDGEPLCGTCYGRAEGADERSDLLFEPRIATPPKLCPGSQTMWVNETARNAGFCLVCGDGVKLRGFGGAYAWNYGIQRHQPGPDLVPPCEFHAWRQLTLTVDRVVACRCKCKEVSV